MRRTASVLLCLGVLASLWPTTSMAELPDPGPRSPARPVLADGQQASPAIPQALPGFDAARSWVTNQLDAGHFKLVGDVAVERGDTQFYADEAEVFANTNTLTATGNVVVATPTSRISADRIVFDFRTKLGTFYNASGFATLGDTKKRDLLGSHEPDVYFYGATIEKIGDRKYRLTAGGFTTCLQPRPRWELTSGTVVLSLDHYAFLTNALMKVKGVPVFYLPVLYYPITKDDRSTGFLLPVYGTSSLRGHSISNAFFFALGRSHDATIVYDWFSKAGMGFGGDYQYVASNASLGNARFYILNEPATSYTDSTGNVVNLPGRRSYTLNGSASQNLPLRLKARGRMDYFSDIQVQQTYNQNIYAASRRQRYFGGNVAGAWGATTVTGSVDRSEVFFNATTSTASGSLPRLTFGRAERPLAGSLVYASVNSEYTSMVRQSTSDTKVTDLGLHRIDVSPTLRVPFSKWPFLTVNSTVAWRYTWWSQSKTVAGQLSDDPIQRTYVDLRARVVGPVLNRIWNMNNRFAEKVKHTVEPYADIQRVSNFDMSNRIIQLDGSDYLVPGVTRIAYGLNNRFYAKPAGGAKAQAREIFSVAVRQSYYTDSRASVVDGSYATGFRVDMPSNFSPVSLQVQATPSVGLDASFRAEYDQRLAAFRSMGLQASWTYKDTLLTAGNWSRQTTYALALPRKVISQNQYLSNQTSLRVKDNRLGSAFSFNYDLQKRYFLQKRIVGYYNAQCCGVTVEYQVFDYSGYPASYLLPVRKDKRINIAITLAGLTTFSNFLGAFGIGNTSTYR